jgi:hypothetical protein
MNSVSNEANLINLYGVGHNCSFVWIVKERPSEIMETPGKFPQSCYGIRNEEP